MPLFRFSATIMIIIIKSNEEDGQKPNSKDQMIRNVFNISIIVNVGIILGPDMTSQ